jgi:hypothetical protein
LAFGESTQFLCENLFKTISNHLDPAFGFVGIGVMDTSALPSPDDPFVVCQIESDPGQTGRMGPR